MAKRNREYTEMLLNKIEYGELSADEIVQECLNWMSESDVQEMCEHNGWDKSDDNESEDY